jgi:antitoxin component of RelBE/YafQ-DinJ toxin-antitoxin module
MGVQMVRDHVVQVRLDDDEKRLLDRVAAGLGLSKSDVLRMGLEAARQGLERLEARRKNMHLLIEMAHEIPGEKIQWKPKY